MMDVFRQLQLTWVVTMLFAAPFWVGIFWRRATTAAAWSTVACSALMFFVIPWLAPRLWPALRVYPSLTVANDIVVTTIRRVASPSDVRRRQAALDLWQTAYQELVDADQKVGQAFGEPTVGGPPTTARWPIRTPASNGPCQRPPRWPSRAPRSQHLAQAKAKLEQLGARPAPLQPGETIEQTTTTGGVAVFWTGGLQPVDAQTAAADVVPPQPVAPAATPDDYTRRIVKRYPSDGAVPR